MIEDSLNSTGRPASTPLAAGQLEESLVFAQLSLDHRLQHEGPNAWWTNMDRLDLAWVLYIDRNADALNLLEQLERVWLASRSLMSRISS